MAQATQPTGFLDLQLNGYGGIDFNSDGVTVAQMHDACALAEKHGLAGFLATIITDTIPAMAARLAAIVAARKQDPLVARMIPGFHVEGPFINETVGYRGAHPVDAIIPGDVDQAKCLLDAADGLVKILTLAPERDAGLRLTTMLAKAGVIVAAGHCDATRDQLAAAADAGLSMFTHLGNGCPMLMNRHDNIVQRALSLSDRLWLGFIADGFHIPMFALGNYLRLAGLEKVFIVTDGTAPSGMGPGRYTVGRWEVVIGAEMVAMAPDGSHLIGSAVTMQRCYENLTAKLGLSHADAMRLTVDNPKRALGQTK